MLDHEDKAESTINAEPNNITPRHRALMRKLVAGGKLGDVCEEMGFSISRASVVVNSPLFQGEMKVMEADVAEKFSSAEAEKSVDVTRELLNDSRERAAKTLNGALDDVSVSARISAAKDILDRTGYAKEDKITANVVVEPSQSLIDVIGRITTDRKEGEGKDGDEEI